MSTAFDQAWATSEKEGNGIGLSQDELIAEFHKLDALVKEHGSRRREIGAQLAAIAEQNKSSQNTVHLASTDGRKVTVTFGVDYDYEAEQMRVVADLLGDRFDGLFQTKIEFVPRRRNLKKFMNTVAADEAVETAKQIIRDATIEKTKTPYVSVGDK